MGDLTLLTLPANYGRDLLPTFQMEPEKLKTQGLSDGALPQSFHVRNLGFKPILQRHAA